MKSTSFGQRRVFRWVMAGSIRAGSLALLMGCTLMERAWGADTVAFSGSGTPPGAPIQFTPAQPTTNDVVWFSARTDGRWYATPCYAAQAHGGVPRLSVDAVRRVATVSFELPIPPICIQILVSGLRGSMGPLSPGKWTLVVQGYGSAEFEVREAAINPPPALTPRLGASGQELELAWPVSASPCVLETSPTPEGAGWTGVSDAVQTNAGCCVVTVPLRAQRMFFRLRSAD